MRSPAHGGITVGTDPFWVACEPREAWRGALVTLGAAVALVALRRRLARP